MAPRPPLRILTSSSLNPFHNLGAESLLLTKNSPLLAERGTVSKPLLFLWRNGPTVVLGRNQNTYSEVNMRAVGEGEEGTGENEGKLGKDGVFVVRRASGGGAVYQDEGNTNFTVITDAATFDRTSNAALVVDALRDVGVAAELRGRNDICLEDGRKVSGSAYQLTAQLACHHGTLLRDVDGARMAQLLTVSKEKLASKGVASVRARVANLVEQVPDLTHESLCASLVRSFHRHFDLDPTESPSTAPDITTVLDDGALRAAKDKLLSPEWRFGRNPALAHVFRGRLGSGEYEVRVSAVRNVVDDLVVYSDSLWPDFVDALGVSLRGVEYSADGMAQGVAAAVASLPRRSDAPDDTMLDELVAWLVANL
jgi:lipoate-protein ligase A